LHRNYTKLLVESWHNTLGKLQGVDVKSNFYAARDKAHPGTGKWFIEGEYFKNWMSKERSLLWLNGIREFTDILPLVQMLIRTPAGCGKTILAYVVLDEILLRAFL
jgi:hypothetical protein